MSLMMPGVYIGEVEEKSYEIATTYQLSYYVSSALITLDLIRDPDEDMLGRFSCVARYYRYYVDHLFYLLGQISNRFVKKESDDRIERNRRNYQFSEETFKIISDKDPRNLIEHLDERNFEIANAYGGVGGFNVVRVGSSPAVVESVTKNRNHYPYTLNLIENKVMFYDLRADGKIHIYDVDLQDLEAELLMLQKNIEDFKSFL